MAYDDASKTCAVDFILADYVYDDMATSPPFTMEQEVMGTEGMETAMGVDDVKALCCTNEILNS